MKTKKTQNALAAGMQNAIAEFIKKDMQEMEHKVYYWNNKAYKNMIYNLYDKAEEKWYKTLKIKYYEAWVDLEQIIYEMEDKEKPLTNDVLKWLIDDFKWLK